MHDRLRHRLLGAWSLLIVRKPWHILFIALLLTLGSIGVTVLGLGFAGNRNDLISKDLDWNQRFIDWQTHFPGAYDLFVIVDANPAGGTPTAQQVAAAKAMVDELGRRLSASPRIEHVVWGFDAGQFSAKTVRMLPMEQMQQRLAEARQAQPLLASPTVQALIGHAATAMRQNDSAQAQRPPQEVARDIDQLTTLVRAVDTVLRTDVQQPLNFARLAGQSDEGWQYLTTGSRLFFLRLTPRSETGKISALAGAIEEIRRIINEVSAQHPGPQAGVTGIEVVEADETDAAMVDSTQASIIAVVLITIVLIAAFHSWKTPLLAMIALLIGIAWSFGLLTVTIGHLQVISVVFTVMLLGLGIAYGIHVAAGFELVRHDYAVHRGGFSKAMRLTLQRMGPGIVTGAVTTAAAFATTLFTDFKGVAEMGFIAGAGIMLCLVAMFSVFPAMLSLVKPKRHNVAPLHERTIHFFKDQWVMPFSRHPWATIITAVVLTGLSLWAIFHMRFDYDLMKLQPRGVESVMWQQRIADESGTSIWFGISVTDSIDEARQRAARFMQQPTVGGVGGIGLLFPDQEPQKLEQLAQLKRELDPALQQALAPAPPPAAGPDVLTQLDLLRRLIGLATAGQDVPAPIREALDRFAAAVDQLTSHARTLDEATRQARLDRLQRDYAAFRLQTAQTLSAMLDPSPLAVADLPEELLRSYRDDRGRLALEIYPRLPQSDDPEFSPLHPRFLPHFIADLEAVDPNITGVIVQIYRSGDLIKTSYQMAGIYALVLVFLLVWLDFRSLHLATLSLIPVAVGFACTFGIMHVMGVSINPANIIVLPLMFGIGVDAGVHMLHRYRMDPTLEPLGLAKGTGKGITITNLTTIIGFGAMTLARHRGIASLGMVLTVGITLTTLACWTVMPAILELHERHRRAKHRT
jgi:hopanoid biosynthesis associated RND transporter like protein HpnN